MKKYIIFLFLATTFNCLLAQNKTKTGIVYYDYVNNHINESYNSYLIFNNTKSHYVTAKDSLGLSDKDNSSKNVDEDVIVEAMDFNNIRKTREKGFQVFLDRQKDSMYFSNAFSLTSKMIYAKEKTPVIKWVLKPETKKIGNFDCKKAIGIFRGRKYICWYTEQIPLSYGPWKIQGLPGLVLEAKTEDNFFIVYFKKIKYPVSSLRVSSSEKSMLYGGRKFLSMKDYIKKQRDEIKSVDNSLRLQAKKFNVFVNPFSEEDNFLEIFGKLKKQR